MDMITADDRQLSAD